jgi:hypothetical protein
MWLALLIAADPGGGAGRTPVSPDAAQRWALLLMLVSLLGVALLVIVAAAWALRRGRRLRDGARDQAPTAMTDAWAEAGRRARGDLLGAGDDPSAPMGGSPVEPPERPDTPFEPPIKPDEGRP